jgi:hypothetical protein
VKGPGQNLAVVAVVAVVSIGAAACGSSSSSKTSAKAPTASTPATPSTPATSSTAGGGSVAAAQANFVKQCHAGHPNDAADLKLCQCAASKLESQHHYTAAQFDTAVKDVEARKNPPDVIAAFAACKKA